MIRVDIEELSRKIDDLKFKINTTPRLLGRFIYERMLVNAEHDLKYNYNRHKRLNLCFDHRQEQNASHYSEHNCDHCMLELQIKGLETQYDNLISPTTGPEETNS